MKKTYSTPKFTSINLDAEDIVCSSNTIESGGNDNGNGTPDARSRNNPIWDD